MYIIFMILNNYLRRWKHFTCNPIFIPSWHLEFSHHQLNLNWRLFCWIPYLQFCRITFKIEINSKSTRNKHGYQKIRKGGGGGMQPPCKWQNYYIRCTLFRPGWSSDPTIPSKSTNTIFDINNWLMYTHLGINIIQNTRLLLYNWIFSMHIVSG